MLLPFVSDAMLTDTLFRDKTIDQRNPSSFEGSAGTELWRGEKGLKGCYAGSSRFRDLENIFQCFASMQNVRCI